MLTPEKVRDAKDDTPALLQVCNLNFCEQDCSTDELVRSPFNDVRQELFPHSLSPQRALLDGLSPQKRTLMI
jgi:hypothetical protein